MERAKRTVLAALYAAGTAAVVLLLLLTAIGSGQVLFPDAMLPMELRELASAWLAIGFLPMLLVSVQFYKIVRRKAVFLPAEACLLALLFWVGVWTAALLRSPAMASGGDIVLPAAEDLEAVRFSGSGLDFDVKDSTFIAHMLQRLSQAKNTGKASVQDVPSQGGEVVRVDFAFKQGGAGTVFLYRDGDLLVEQPYHWIYRLNDGSLDHYAWDSLVCTEGRLSARYGPWDTAVWREAGVVEFYTQRSFAFGGVEKGFYYSKSDTTVCFQAAGYPLMEDGEGWSWTDPNGNHGNTRRIRPRWFWFEAVL